MNKKRIKIPLFPLLVLLILSTIAFNTILIYYFANQRVDSSYAIQVRNDLENFSSKIDSVSNIPEEIKKVKDIYLYCIVIDTESNSCIYSNVDGMVNQTLSDNWNPAPNVYFNMVLGNEDYIIIDTSSKYYSVFNKLVGLNIDDSFIALKKLNENQFLIVQTSTIFTVNVMKTINRLVISSFMIIFPIVGGMAFIAIKMATIGIKRISEYSNSISKREFLLIPNSRIKEIDSISESLNHISVEFQKYDVSQKMFIANMSHELKTPISIISGYAEGLKMGLAEDKAILEEYCDTIIEECNKTDQLIVDMIKLLKSETMDLEYEEKKMLDMDILVNKLLSNYTYKMSKFNLFLISNKCPNSYIYANKILVQSIVENLLSNAFKYCSDGGVIETTVVKNKDSVVFSVYNDCEKIEDDISRFWDRFYKGNSARTRDSTSTGIGLSIVKALCEKAGFKYESKLQGKGIIFTITIPTEQTN